MNRTRIGDDIRSFKLRQSSLQMRARAPPRSCHDTSRCDVQRSALGIEIQLYTGQKDSRERLRVRNCAGFMLEDEVTRRLTPLHPRKIFTLQVGALGCTFMSKAVSPVQDEIISRFEEEVLRLS